MAENSKIQWTDNTFNPWIGCTKVSPGCANCYAEKAYASNMLGVNWGKGQPRHITSPSTWAKVKAWNNKARKTNTRSKIFVASLCDVFDAEVSQGWRNDLWAMLDTCTSLDFQLLTKRLNVLSVDDLLEMVPESWRSQFPGHIWFGHSVTTQEEADRIISLMAQIPAQTRFISLEPMLEAVRLPSTAGCLSWSIIGGESGPNARPFKAEWVRYFLEDCDRYGIAPFVKQMGSESNLFLKDKKGGDWTEWPRDLRRRQFPATLHHHSTQSLSTQQNIYTPGFS